jgi:hypothetical protein
MQNDSKSQPLTVRAPKVISKLVKLERKISRLASRVRGGMNRAQARLKNRRTIAAFTNAIKQKLVSVIALSRDCGLAIAKSARKLIYAAIHGGSRPTTRKSNVVPPEVATTRKKPTSDRANALERLFISACFGLIGMCGILIVVLFLQIRDMKTKIAQWEIKLATNIAHLNRVERLAQQTIVKEPTPAIKAPEVHLPLSFSEAEIKTIRQYIKVLPPKPGTQQKIHLGDEIPDSAVAPVPQSLIDQLPKLRGARFSIDQDGAIIIIGEGSKRVDAVLSYQ